MVVSEKVSLGLAEAVVIALPNEKYLFSLISDATSFSLIAFGDVPGVRKNDDGSFVQWDESARRIQNLVGAKAFPPEHLPMLVTFDDINDPTTVNEVDSANLAATLGEGYSLKSITLEITTEAITQGEVVKVLGWLYLHKYRLRSPDLRLGKGPHAASDILPEEELRRSNFNNGKPTFDKQGQAHLGGLTFRDGVCVTPGVFPRPDEFGRVRTTTLPNSFGSVGEEAFATSFEAEIVRASDEMLLREHLGKHAGVLKMACGDYTAEQIGRIGDESLSTAERNGKRAINEAIFALNEIISNKIALAA